MHLFRFKILVALIALIFAGSIVEQAYGACEPATSEHSHDDGSPAETPDHECHCVCHQAFVNEPTAPASCGALLSVLSLVSDQADYPPDAIPVGIDHPPQLA